MKFKEQLKKLLVVKIFALEKQKQTKKKQVHTQLHDIVYVPKKNESIITLIIDNLWVHGLKLYKHCGIK